MYEKEGCIVGEGAVVAEGLFLNVGKADGEVTEVRDFRGMGKGAGLSGETEHIGGFVDVPEGFVQAAYFGCRAIENIE